MAAQTRKFFAFVAKFLEEQGINLQEIVEAYAEEEGLAVASRTDLVDRLREQGFYNLNQPERPEARVVERDVEGEVVAVEKETGEQTRETTDFSAKPTPTTATLANGGGVPGTSQTGTAVVEETDQQKEAARAQEAAAAAVKSEKTGEKVSVEEQQEALDRISGNDEQAVASNQKSDEQK